MIYVWFQFFLRKLFDVSLGRLVSKARGFVGVNAIQSFNISNAIQRLPIVFDFVIFVAQRINTSVRL